MRVFVIGGGSTRARTEPPAAFVVEHQGNLLAIECPAPTPYAVSSAARVTGLTVDVADINTWFVSKPHSATISGLETIGLERLSHKTGPATVISGPTVMQALADRYRASAAMQQIALDGTPAPIPLREMFHGVVVDPADAVECGPFLIEVRPVVHTLPAYAVRVAAGMKSFAYSSDTLFDESLLDFLTSADMFAHTAAGGDSVTNFDELDAALSIEQKARCLLVHHDQMRKDQLDAAESGGYTFAVSGAIFEV